MYDTIGKILIGVLILSLILSFVALSVSKMSLTRHVMLAGFFSNILDFFYMPLKYLFYRFSDTRILDKWMVSMKNTASESAFATTKHRIMLAPHCMRSLDCPASSTRDGIKCVACGKCVFSKLKEDVEEYGYTLYIITGSSFVKHVLRSEKVDGILLIACDYELNKVMRALKGSGVVSYGVPMLNDGCYDTKVDYERVMNTIRFFESSDPEKGHLYH